MHFTPVDQAESSELENQARREFYEIARVEWRRIVRELGTVPGLLTSVDGDAIAMYAETYARWVMASQKLAMGGLVVEMATQNGGKYMATSPYMAIVNQCLKTMKQLLTEFGMTPASRTRIQIEKPPEEDPFDEFLSRR